MTPPDSYTVSVIDPENFNFIEIEYESYDPYECTIHHNYGDVVGVANFDNTDLGDFIYFDVDNDLIMSELTYHEIGE